jgi:signal transduction histidine kinase
MDTNMSASVRLVHTHLLVYFGGYKKSCFQGSSYLRNSPVIYGIFRSILNCMQKPIYLLFSALLLYIALPAQTPTNRDSLLRLLPLAREDSNAVLLLIRIGQQFEGQDLDKAKQYYDKAASLSKKIRYPLGIIKSIANQTFVLNQQGKFDSSLQLNLESVRLSRQIKDSVYLAKTLFNTGTSYRNLGNYEKAVAAYEEGKQLFMRFGDSFTEALSSDILQVVYYELHQYQKAIEFGQHAVALAKKMGDQYIYGLALNNLGLNYIALNQLPTADSLFKEALKVAVATDDKNLEQSSYLNLGNNMIQRGEYESMKPLMDKALALNKELGIPESHLLCLKGYAYYYTYKKDYRKAQLFAEEALAISYANDLKPQRVKVLDQLSGIAHARQNMLLGNQYAQHSALLSDSLLNGTIQRTTLELEEKYASAAKVARIKNLEDEQALQQLSLRQKTLLNYFLLGAAVLLGIIFFLSYRNYRQKRFLQQQQINELEAEKKQMATEAVLKGEEKERTRLARDLHDGLGGMLSGIKYSFQNMKGNLILTQENAQDFERSMDMLDSSIREMRRVAHNLMPEALVKFGLDTALKDFFKEINRSGILKVRYQSIGLDTTSLDQTLSITVYRIIQELINNTIKHAGASEAVVQISLSDGQLSITAEDNGKGFDLAKVKGVKGIGWSNIQNRIDFLKGTFDIRSVPGHGCSVQIELPCK